MKYILSNILYYNFVSVIDFMKVTIYTSKLQLSVTKLSSKNLIIKILLYYFQNFIKILGE